MKSGRKLCDLRRPHAPLCLKSSRTFPRQGLHSRNMGPRIALDGNATCGRVGFRRRGLPPDPAADGMTGIGYAPKGAICGPRYREERDTWERVCM